MKTEDLFRAIDHRRSVRSFLSREITVSDREEIATILTGKVVTPFPGMTEFQLVGHNEHPENAFRSTDSYGFIKGAKDYILALVDSPVSFEALGYVFEYIVLQLSVLGFGTCWMGGTFNKALFKQLKLNSDMYIAAISPIGYPEESMAVRERLIRWGAGSNRRKPLHELMCHLDEKTPWKGQSTHDIRLFEAVQKALSASNRQPWRLLCDKSGNIHFYLKRTPRYRKIGAFSDLQKIDMGIACAHLTIAADFLGYKGQWAYVPQSDGILGEYLISYLCCE